MSDQLLRYEVKVRSSTEEYWTVYGLANSQEHLTGLVERAKLSYRYVTWNTYRTR